MLLCSRMRRAMLIPVDARHVHVEGGDVGVVGTDGIHAVETVVDREDVETGAREHLDEKCSNVGIIVDDDGGLPCGLAHRRPPCCVCWSDCARLRGPLPRRSRRGYLLAQRLRPCAQQPLRGLNGPPVPPQQRRAQAPSPPRLARNGGGKIDDHR